MAASSHIYRCVLILLWVGWPTTAYPVCSDKEVCGYYTQHCCWEPELGCNVTVSDREIDCSDEVSNVQVRVTGPLEFLVSWSLPETTTDNSRTVKYLLVVYDAYHGYDNYPPYSTGAKRVRVGNYADRFNRNVAPCKVWYSDIDHTALYESGSVSSLTVVDSGKGVSAGTLGISSTYGQGFHGTYDICPLPTTRREHEASKTGLSHGICNVAIVNPGEYFFENGAVNFSSDATMYATSPPRIAFQITKSLSTQACTSLQCRPAFRFNDNTAAGFQTSQGESFAGLEKGHEYAFAVIRERDDGFSKFPQFDADRLGTLRPGGWAKKVALGIAAPPSDLEVYTCIPLTITVVFDLPHDLGALSESERRAAVTRVGQLSPVSPVEAIGGLSGILQFHVQLSSSAAFATTRNFTYTEPEAKHQAKYRALLTGDFGDGALRYVRVAVETAAGVGEWAISTTSYPWTNLPSAPALEIRVTVQARATIHLIWHLPFDTGRKNGTEKSGLEPILGYELRLQGKLLYEGHPSRSHTCGLSEPAQPNNVCCVKWKQQAGQPGGCDDVWVCEKLSLSLRGQSLGENIQFGSSFLITVRARNALGYGEPSFVDIMAGTARDSWGRPAAHCTTNLLPECAANLTGAVCSYSNLSAAWCNARPGETAGFGAVPAEDEDECELETHNCDPDATCANTEGSFTCTCNRGFHSDGEYSCVDNEECATSHNCVGNATCINTVGSFQCTCAPAFYGTNATDLCSPCPSHSETSAANSTTAMDCLCVDGYTSATGQGPCTDLDECVAGNHTCAVDGGACANTEGSFTCSCDVDYYGDGFTCTACMANATAAAGSESEDAASASRGSRESTPHVKGLFAWSQLDCRAKSRESSSTWLGGWSDCTQALVGTMRAA
eukprot:CAMPEP_0181316572 /NCGR_PEP_ID=MMETSP1101-20121128/15968_1 /TAXON_ID=46948 /ORGANISM="Rhodomonas abbreviata, Strain Caron Lab Isolate" /LENGTH=892 /DNA_ID=CAMNT_0023423831 /DNA_START=127 /DNA_END=2806 /DNA_ORIENTATION=-